MEIRKQARRSPPQGQEPPSALALGHDEPESPDTASGAGSGLERRLLETERRAALAEAALLQVRSDAERGLADARDALARERDALLAAEREPGDVHPAAAPELAGEAAPEPAVEPEPDQVAAPGHAAEAEPDAPPRPIRSEPGSGEDGEAERGTWPTPWLEPARSRSGARRRRPFGRTRAPDDRP